MSTWTMSDAFGFFLAFLVAILAFQIAISLIDRWRSRIKARTSIREANELLRSRFDPILLPWGYKAGPHFETSRRCIVPYDNPDRGLKVEVALSSAGSGWFSMVLSKRNMHEQVDYSDGLNSMELYDLARLTPDHSSTRSASPDTKKDDALANAVRLIERHNRFFTATRLPTADLITQLRTYAEEGGYDTSFISPNHRDELHARLRARIVPLMSEHAFELVKDTTELPPYDMDHMTPRLIFKGQRCVIEVGRYDWRDHPYIQVILIDRREVFSVDVSKHGDDGAIDALARELENRVKSKSRQA